MLSLLVALQLVVAPAEVGPVSFAVKIEGSGPPMILVPGFVSSGVVWDDVVAHYKARYECHVLTLAGFAGVPAREPASLARVRDEIVQYIRARKLTRPVLVGHSLGAFVAMWVAATAPDLAGPVVAIDGVPFFSALFDPAATPDSVRPQAEQMRAMNASRSPEQFALQSRMFLVRMISDPGRVDVATKWAAASDPVSAARLMADLMTIDIRADVARIASPLLLIGAGKALTTPEQLAAMRKAYESQVSKVPTHEVVFAENALHFIMYDDLPFLVKTMDAFLRRASGPAAGRAR